MPDDLMLDIETLGQRPGCIILQVGAVKFSDDGVRDGREWTINRESCENLGLVADNETVQWWHEQPEYVREAVFGGEYAVEDALQEFIDYAKDVDKVWANSPSFDCRIVEAAADRCDLELPWDFWDQRCVRTIIHAAREATGRRVRIPRNGDEHTALADARHQVEGVQEALRILHGLREQGELV